MRPILLIAGNILALFLASYYIEGVVLAGGVGALITVGLIFSAVNFFLKPVVKLLLGPFILLSFGLLVIVVNMAMLWMTDFLAAGLHIAGIGPLFLSTILVSIVNFAVHIAIRK